ncbi:hypothetical protein NKH18_01940 [Streptomyces sp. M10(2022)]
MSDVDEVLQRAGPARQRVLGDELQPRQRGILDGVRQSRLAGEVEVQRAVAHPACLLILVSEAILKPSRSKISAAALIRAARVRTARFV